MKKYTKLVVIAGIVVLLDQITKFIILKTIPLFRSIPVIEGFFGLTHLENPGGAFSFLAGQSLLVRKIAFLFLPFVAICLIFLFYKSISEKQRWISFALALIIGGAIGNLIDRIIFGKVVDFLDFYIKDMHWPPFNIADSAISIGLMIFIFNTFLGQKE